jgi:hypothetical protein
MKNTIITYNKRDIDEYSVSDYFSKNISIADILFQYPNLLAIYNTTNGDKLERISYELYGTTNYWDILLMLNKRDPLFEIPYDFDIIYDLTEAQLAKYVELSSSIELTDERKEAIREQIFQEAQEANESYRTLYVVKKDKIGDALFILKSLGKI